MLTYSEARRAMKEHAMFGLGRASSGRRWDAVDAFGGSGMGLGRVSTKKLLAREARIETRIAAKEADNEVTSKSYKRDLARLTRVETKLAKRRPPPGGVTQDDAAERQKLIDDAVAAERLAAQERYERDKAAWIAANNNAQDTYGGGGGSLRFEDAATGGSASEFDGIGLTTTNGATVTSDDVKSAGGSMLPLAAGAGLLIFGLKGKKGKSGTRGLVRRNPPTSLVLLAVAAAAGYFYYRSKNPLSRLAAGPWKAAQEQELIARNAAEKNAMNNVAATRALMIGAFREGGTREVVVPYDSPRLQQAQWLGLRIANQLGAGRFATLSDAQVINYLTNEGIA